MSTNKTRMAVMALFTSLFATTPATAVNYEFELVISTSGVPIALGIPALSNGGEVAFHADFTGGDSGVFHWNTASGVSTIIDSFGSWDSFGTRPSINDLNQVAWTGVQGSRDFLNLGTLGAGSVELQSSDGDLNSFESPSVNNSGAVVFSANVDAGGEGIFVADTGGRAGIIETGNTNYERVDDPVIGTNTGRLAYETSDFVYDCDLFGCDFEYANERVVRNDRPAETLVAGASGPGVGVFIEDINDAGFVLYEGFSGSYRYMRYGDGSTSYTVADNSGVFDDFFDGAINSSNQVAFTAELDSGTEGIYTGSSPVGDKVIEVGDSLSGLTITSLGLYREALNDAGQIAFLAGLSDGTEAIYVASVGAVVPVPPAIWLFGSALGALGWIRRRSSSPSVQSS